MNLARKKSAWIRHWSALGLAMLAISSGPAVGAREQEKSQPAKPAGSDSGLTTKLRIEVIAGEKDEPVESASIYVKYTRERTLKKDEKIEMNTKTNRSGVAIVGEVPRGKVLIQVIAQGWKTFGQWYELEKTEHTIKIKLQKPPRWY